MKNDDEYTRRVFWRQVVGRRKYSTFPGFGVYVASLPWVPFGRLSTTQFPCRFLNGQESWPKGTHGSLLGLEGGGGQNVTEEIGGGGGLEQN